VRGAGRFPPGVGVTEAFIESTTVGSDQDLPLSRLTLWRIPRPAWYLPCRALNFVKKHKLHPQVDRGAMRE